MPRINIEDQLFTDGRFKVLESIMGTEMAIGAFVVVARLAQTYWVPGKKMMPKNIFCSLPYSQKLIDCGLVSIIEDGAYLAGSEHSFDWILTRTENGKKGGRPRKIKPKDNLKKPKHNLNETKTEPKHNPQSQSQSQSQSTISSSVYSKSYTADEIAELEKHIDASYLEEKYLKYDKPYVDYRVTKLKAWLLNQKKDQSKRGLKARLNMFIDDPVEWAKYQEYKPEETFEEAIARVSKEAMERDDGKNKLDIFPICN